MKKQRAAGTAKASDKTKTLYEISRDYSEFEDLVNSIEGEVSADDESKLAEYLAVMNKDRDQKFDNYVGYIRDLEARTEARKNEAERFAKLARVGENKIKRLKWVLLNFMQTHKLEKVETNRFVLRKAQSASAPVVLDDRYIQNPEELEERFRTVTFKPNLKEIAQALKDGEELDFAKFGEKGENLRIS